MHQRCSNYTLTNLLFGLCKSVWVSDLFVNLPSPISEFQHAPLPLKCCELRSMPNSFSFRCLLPWTRSWVHQGVCGCIAYNQLMKGKMYFVLICPCTSKHSSFKHRKTLGIESVIVGGSCMMTKFSWSAPMVTLLGCRTSTKTIGKQIYEIAKKNYP
jgi:hypothetical protein